MTEDRKTDELLEGFFDSARREANAPDAAFMARLSTDMQAALPHRTPVRAASPGLFQRFASILAASGLAGATALGVWIGFVMPETLNGFLSDATLSDTYDIGAFLPAADLSALSE